MPYPTESDVFERICWSADVPDSPTMFGYLRDMSKLRKIKVDRLFVDTNGFRTLADLREFGLDVFDDAKISEIPSKLEAVARVHVAYRPWMLNCMASSASGGLVSADDRDELEGLKRFADVCHEHDVRPCAVTVLTSKKPEFVRVEFGKSTEEQVLFYVELLLGCGFTDVVCSPLEVPLIRSESRFDGLSLVTPGIKRGGGSNADQARSNTPAGAFSAGSDILVIGRDLTTGNPAENLDAIVTEVLDV